jgi:hypothetical protein
MAEESPPKGTNYARERSRTPTPGPPSAGKFETRKPVGFPRALTPRGSPAAPGSAPPPPGSAGSQARTPGSAPKDGNHATPRPLGLFSAICFFLIVVLLSFTVVVSLLFVISRPKHI